MNQVSTISRSPRAREKCPLGRSTRILLELPEAFLHFLELSAAFGQRPFQGFDDVLRRATAKRLVFQSLLFRSNVLREPFEVFAQAVNLTLNVKGCFVSDVQIKILVGMYNAPCGIKRWRHKLQTF